MLQYQNSINELSEHFWKEYKKLFTVGIVGEFAPLVFTNPLTSATYQPKVQWLNKEQKDVYSQAEHFVKFYAQDLICEQSSLVGDRKAIYDTTGFVIVDLFFAKIAASTENDNNLKRGCQKIFLSRKTENGIWFRRPTIEDLPAEDRYYRARLNVEYLYQSRN